MSEILINGIYDLRTLKSLQLDGIKNYSFDFNPRSQTFIQEYIFINLIDNISSNEFIFLRFKNNEDYFIQRILDAIKKSGLSPLQFCFIFEEVTSSIIQFNNSFMTYYQPTNIKILNSCEHLRGLVFNSKDLELLFTNNTIKNFYNNLFLVFNNFVNFKNSIDINWGDSLVSSVNDLFEFNYYIFSINSHIEICYRNVNLIKLKNEIDFKKKDITI